MLSDVNFDLGNPEGGLRKAKVVQLVNKQQY